MSFLSRPEYLLRPQNILRRVALRPLLRRRQVTVRLAFGKRIMVQEGEFIGNNIINTRCHDPALGECLWRLVSEGDVCVDVGANIGYTTILMAHRCGERGRCVSFEADPALHKRLVENLRLNGLERIVTAHNLAASGSNTKLLFQRAEGDNHGLGRVVDEKPDGAEAIEVTAVRLDEHVSGFKRIKVVKIDVEGHEGEVLKGLRETLGKRVIENIVFEEHGGHGAESFRQLEGSGYTIFRIGRTLRGPRLANAGVPAVGDLEPNFIATLNDGGLRAAMSRPGWHVF